MGTGLSTGLPVHAPETDLIGVNAGDGGFEPDTVHTHYFGFQVPEAGIGAYTYIRYQPWYPLCQGGVVIFQGLDHRVPLDAAYHDYRMTMPYPDVDGLRITTANGYAVEFLELGRSARITYESADATFDITQVAVTPLVARGAVIPGENLHASHEPGGSEQFMHCTGELVVNGDRHAVDCFPIRDRSWRQVRSEREIDHPPVGWSPMCFGDDLMFNQVGFEAPDTGPAWKGLFDVADDARTFHFGFVWADGEARSLTRVRRDVARYHPELFAALEQTIEAEDETGKTWRFHGRALAMAHLPSWPNNFFVDAVYRWEAEDGRVAHCTYQEAWYRKFHRAMTVG